MPDGIFGGVVAGSGGVVSDGDINARAAGRGFRCHTGTAGDKAGTAVLVAGTLLVANAAVTAASIIILTCQVPGGAPGFLQVSARVAGASFTILSSNGADTSTVGWLIIEPS